MGKTFEALQRAEKEYQKKKRQAAIESQNKSTRLKIAYFGLLALLPLVSIIVVYGFLQKGHRVVVPDLKDLEAAKARITELENVVAMRDQMLSRSEQTLKELQSNLEEEKKTRKELQLALSSKTAVVAELQEQLRISQANYLNLKDEITKSKGQIEGLQTQLTNFEKEKTSAEATPLVVQINTSQPKAASAVIVQDNSQPGNPRPQTDALAVTSETTNQASMTIGFKGQAVQEMQKPSDDVGISLGSPEEADSTQGAKPAATSGNDRFTEEAEPPDPTAVIDWLLKKHSQ